MITMDNIVKDGHPVLREIAKEVSLPPSDEEKAILNSMLDYLIQSQDEKIAEKYGLRAGVGLAAPQINVSKRMIAIHAHDEKEKLHSYTLINPKIVSHSVQRTYLESGEGCLSVDESIPGYVPRYARVTIKAFDIHGSPVKLRLKGFLAVVIQHEIDHLNGVMFYDHIDRENPFKQIDQAVPIERE